MLINSAPIFFRRRGRNILSWWIQHESEIIVDGPGLNDMAIFQFFPVLNRQTSQGGNFFNRHKMSPKFRGWLQATYTAWEPFPPILSQVLFLSAFSSSLARHDSWAEGAHQPALEGISHAARPRQSLLGLVNVAGVEPFRPAGGLSRVYQRKEPLATMPTALKSAGCAYSDLPC